MILYLFGMMFTFIVLWILPEDEKFDVRPLDQWLGFTILSIVWPVVLIALIVRELGDCCNK